MQLALCANPGELSEEQRRMQKVKLVVQMSDDKDGKIVIIGGLQSDLKCDL